VWRHSDELHSKAVARVLNGERVAVVAQELDVHKRLLRAWVAAARKAAGSQPAKAAVGQRARKERLQRENEQLKRALADKTLELDFFKGALQKVEARRQPHGKAGGTASTTKSGK
jgi:transposase-like protein